MAQVHGGRLVARALARHGVKHVFTLSGAHVQAIYDGCIDEKIRVVDTRHAATAGHAAEGSAKIDGLPGVAIVAAGPGVTDVMTAVATAAYGGVPMVCIGGAGPHALAGLGSFQDLDAVGLMQTVAKWSARVPEASRIQEYVDAAFRIARANVPGPVYLEVPLDFLMNPSDDAAPLTRPMAPSRSAGDPDAIQRAAELLRGARRPTFIVGSELRSSPKRDVLRSFAESVNVPFFLNGLARGALPQSHPSLFAHSRSLALSESDVVFVLGTPFDFRVDYGRAPAWNPSAVVVQVSLDGAELGRNRGIDVAIQGDSGLVLEALLAAVGQKAVPEFLARLRAEENERRNAASAAATSSSDAPTALGIATEVHKRLGPEDTVIADDFVATAGSALPVEWPQLWMDPGPLGTIGVGPGYAMAAAVLRPHARTVVLFGDGAFGLHTLEFEAMVRQGLPIVAVVGNDAAWTHVRQRQIETYGQERAVATALSFTRYDKIVEALGGLGFWVERASGLGPALDAALASGVPACVNVRLEPIA